MSTKLMSRQEAEVEIAALTATSCDVAVMEEYAFVGMGEQEPAVEDKWLQLGSICLKLAPQPGGERVDEEHQRALLAGDGAFEWLLPSASDAKGALADLLGERDDAAVGRALDAAAAIGVRAGLLNPVFGAEGIEDMPFRRTTTVVSDTSGVLQGGLNFIARHVPKARLKVPVIVQMEIRESSNRFLEIRRKSGGASKKKRATRHLMEHMGSQGGERVLLRLEFQDDVEVERTYLHGDPLRGAFKLDRDRTVSDLQLSIPLVSYADRLILEAARQHQAQSEPGHAVRLLTGDQGQARMALAEGVKPLYLRTTRADEVFGQRLTGRPLDPFTGEPRPVPLASLLWELATAFGTARLSSDAGTCTVSALGENLPWSPYHSMDDLLWCDIERKGASPFGPDRKATVRPRPAAEPAGGPRYQRINVNHLLTLICVLNDRQVMDGAEVNELLELTSRSTSHYRRFLVSAGHIEVDGYRWHATERLEATSVAARNEDALAVLAGLRHAPSVHAIVERVERVGKGEPLDLSDLGRPERAYLMLAEITLLCASVGNDGVYPTLNRPAAEDFSMLALARFRELAGAEKIVPTGLWLERLIQQDGIHPEVAKELLEQASKDGLLRRSTEGSTTQTRYDDHVVHALRVEDGKPWAKPIRLYRGDYLIPGKASVSLRLEEPKQ